MSARTGLTEGFRTGALLALGIASGAVFWAASAMFGLNLLFRRRADAAVGAQTRGAAYLLWLAWQLWREARDAAGGGRYRRPFRGRAVGRFPAGADDPTGQPQTRGACSRPSFWERCRRETPSWVYAALLIGGVCQ